MRLLSPSIAKLWFICLGFIVSYQLRAEDKKLVILHTNDMHARVIGVRSDDAMCAIEERDSAHCFGGFDRIATQVALIKSQHKNVLLLDAGDQFQGSIFHMHYRGQASGHLMSLIGYQGMAVGNHEFDNGTHDLLNFAQSVKFPLLSANIDASRVLGLKSLIKPYTIIEQQGMRIGVLGYTTEDTAFLSSPGPHIKFLPVVEAVKKAVLALKKARVDVIVAVSHAGLNQDIAVAKAVPDIAVIIGGHSNSLLSNKQEHADGPCPLVVKSPGKHATLLVSAYAYGKYLGQLSFSFDKKGHPTAWAGEPILLDHKLAHDKKIRHEIDKLYEPIKLLQSQPVFIAPRKIDGQSCRFKECAFGNLITDAMLDFSRPFGVEIALMNSGGIRASAPKGAVTMRHLEDIMPFDKTLVLYKLSGSLIKRILEHGVFFVEDKKNSNTGRFLQVSGLRYSFDPKDLPGSRIKDVAVLSNDNQWQPLDERRIYGVVINSYMAQGGDNYTYFANIKEQWSINMELKPLLSLYAKDARGQLPKREGRIINVANAPRLIHPLANGSSSGRR